MNVGRTREQGIKDLRVGSLAGLAEVPEACQEDVKNLSPNQDKSVPVASFNASL